MDSASRRRYIRRRCAAGSAVSSREPSDQMTPCNTLWIGPTLSRVERACFRSVLRAGHPLVLYCYDEPAGIPEGVEVRDAAAVLPRESVIRHSSGSVALFSNWFRYELQRRGAGIWLDSDVYLLRPIDGERRYLFGHEDSGTLNGAVLRLPADSALLARLLAIFEESTVPPWLTGRERLRARWRLPTTGRTGLAKMPWGVAGPRALTALAADEGLTHWALPRHVFYPRHYTEAGWILDPAASLESVANDGSIGVHLWNEEIKHFKDKPAPPGSFLARLHAEGG